MILELGAKSGDLGENSGELGAKSGDLGINSGELGVKSGDLGVNSGELGTKSGDLGANLGELGANFGELGTKSGDLGAQTVEQKTAAEEPRGRLCPCSTSLRPKSENSGRSDVSISTRIRCFTWRKWRVWHLSSFLVLVAGGAWSCKEPARHGRVNKPNCFQNQSMIVSNCRLPE